MSFERLDDHARHVAAIRQAKRERMAAIGIDETYVARMVDDFYRRIRSDDRLGPVFAARIEDWDHHLQTMRRFWRSVLFSSGEFAGNPMLKHIAIRGLEQGDFDHWLRLFDETLADLGSCAARHHVHAQASAIANSLMTGISRSRFDYDTEKEKADASRA